MQFLYVILNTVNGKQYVGVSDNPAYRWRQHQDLARTGDTRPLYASIRKHGVDAFQFRVFQEVSTREEAYAAEMYWVNFWETFRIEFGYNLTKGGLRAQDIVVHDGPVTQRKPMPDSMREAARKTQTGRKRSPETILRMREAQQNRKPLSDEARARMSASQRGLKHSEKSKKKCSEANKGKIAGSKNPAAKLDDEKVRQIKLMLRAGEKRSVIAARFSIGYGAIGQIDRCETWRHVYVP